MSKFASVVLFGMIGSIINAPDWYTTLVLAYFILCIGDDHFTKITRRNNK